MSTIEPPAYFSTFILFLALTACSTARIVHAPPDGKHIPMTVECAKLNDCTDLIESVCRHKHYAVNSSTETNGVYRVKIQCNP